MLMSLVRAHCVCCHRLSVHLLQSSQSGRNCQLLPLCCLSVHLVCVDSLVCHLHFCASCFCLNLTPNVDQLPHFCEVNTYIVDLFTSNCVIVCVQVILDILQGIEKCQLLLKEDSSLHCRL